MTLSIRLTLGLAVLVTIAAVGMWQLTGGDYYTKFEVVEQIERPVDESDPLAAAGFYEGDSQTDTVTRSAFRFGLLPTPNGLFDKHMLSVVSIAFVVWPGALTLVWLSLRRKRAVEVLAR